MSSNHTPAIPRRVLIILAILAATGAAVFAAWRLTQPETAVLDPALIGAPLPETPTAPILTMVGFPKTNGVGAPKPEDVQHVGAAPAAALFSAEDLAALPQHEIVTETEWTEGETRFRGPLLRDVIAFAGGGESDMRVFALNDYLAQIPYQDIINYDVILANHINGDRLTAEDRGPIWIAYPTDTHPELQNSPMIKGRWVWNLYLIARD